MWLRFWARCWTNLPFWFRKWLQTLPASFFLSSGVEADPTLNLVSICRISLIVGLSPTLKLREWSRLPSCRWNQRSGSVTILFSDEPYFLRKSRDKIFWRERVVTHWRYCSSYSISTVTSIVLIRFCYSINLIQGRWYFLFLKIGLFEVNWKVWIYKLLCIVDH
jgi:hypothetical protein